MIGHRKLISMILKKDEVAILQTGKNVSSLLFLKEHEESGDQLVGQKYSEKSVRTLPRFSILLVTSSALQFGGWFPL